MKRNDRIISLNGNWEAITNNTNEYNGYLNADSNVLQIQVPGVFEESLPGYEGVVWYEKSFDIPSDWQGARVFLSVGAANYLTHTWVNGIFTGCHEGGYTPFVFEITTALKETDNKLVMRVLDPPRNGEQRIDGYRTGPGLSSEIPCGKEGWYFNFGGIWQDVEIFATGSCQLEDIFCKGNITNGELEVQATSNSSTFFGKGTLQIDVVNKQNRAEATTFTCEVRIHPGRNLHIIKGTVENPWLWSVENPNLYIVTARLFIDGNISDIVNFQFGFREFKIKDGYFNLNGEPVIIRSVLVQGYYPKTLAYPESKDLALKEVRLAKEAGLNMLRQHIKPPHPWVLEAADELGMLIYDESPIGWIEYTPEMLGRCLSEVREMIIRDRNHPSVVIWGLLNELSAWGHTIGKELAALAKSLDSSRVIITDSGVGGIYNPGSFEEVALGEIHIYNFGPIKKNNLKAFEHLEGNGKPIFLSEFGNGNLGDFDAILQGFDEKYGIDCELEDKIFYANYRQRILEKLNQYMDKTVVGSNDAKIKLRALVDISLQAQHDFVQEQFWRFLLNKNAAGYVLTGLYDAHEEFQGILDVWRNPKPLYYAVQRSNTQNLPVFWSDTATCFPGETVQLKGGVINCRQLPQELSYTLTLNGTPLHSAKVLLGEHPFQSLCLFEDLGFEAPKDPGVYQLELCVDGLDNKTQATFEVIQPWKAEKRSRILSTNALLSEYLRSVGYEVIDPGKLKYESDVGLICLRDYDSSDLHTILSHVEHGGKALVLLEPDFNKGQVPEDMNGILPFGIHPKRLADPYIASIHYASDHPIFSSLGTGFLATRKWSEIFTPYSLKGITHPPIAGCFIGSWFYPNVDEEWFGADLMEYTYGKGKLLLSTYSLLDAVKIKDRVGQKLLCNICDWLGNIPMI